MLEVLIYDWKESVNELFDDIKEKAQGKTCFFYEYDSGSDEYVYIISDHILTEKEIKEAVDNWYSEN